MNERLWVSLLDKLLAEGRCLENLSKQAMEEENPKNLTLRAKTMIKRMEFLLESPLYPTTFRGRIADLRHLFKVGRKTIETVVKDTKESTRVTEVILCTVLNILALRTGELIEKLLDVSLQGLLKILP